MNNEKVLKWNLLLETMKDFLEDNPNLFISRGQNKFCANCVRNDMKCKDCIFAKPAGIIKFIEEMKSSEEVEVKIQKSFPTFNVHTDGACSGNPGPGGWAYVAYDENGEEINCMSGGYPDTTNNRMELKAIVQALEGTPPANPIMIHSDSLITIKCITGEYRMKTNLDLWKQYKECAKGRTIKTIWEPRDNSTGNRKANKLAQDEAQEIKLSVEKTNKKWEDEVLVRE